MASAPTPAPETQGASPIAAVAEVVAVFLIYSVIVKYHETTWLSLAQARLVGWHFNAHILMMALPLAVVLVTGRNFTSLGLDPAQWRDPVVVRLCRVAVPELMVIGLVISLGWWALKGEAPRIALPPEPFPPSRVVWGSLCTVVFTTFFCGVGEEIFFRGYLQGRLNMGLGRPWQFRGVRFGAGLLLVSALFGLGHGLAVWNPIADRSWALHWGAAEALKSAVTFGEGLLLGLIYEHTRGLLAPMVIHAALGLFFGSFAFA